MRELPNLLELQDALSLTFQSATIRLVDSIPIRVRITIRHHGVTLEDHYVLADLDDGKSTVADGIKHANGKFISGDLLTYDLYPVGVVVVVDALEKKMQAALKVSEKLSED